MSDQHLFCGWVREEDQHLVPAGAPLVAEWDGDPWAAVWPYGSGGAPHARIVGTTGGGKSSLLRSLLRGLVRGEGVDRRAVIVIDGEGAGEFTVFEGMPGIAQVINVNPAADARLPDGAPTSVELAAQAVADTLALSIERNEERLTAAEAWRRHLIDPAHTQPPRYQAPGEVWLIIDGWGSLRYDLNRYGKTPTDTVEDAVMIGRNGRKTDVHLVIADQVTYASRSKDDDGMPSRLKKQLACSIAAVGALGLSKSEGEMGFDDGAAGKLVPPVPGGSLMKVGATAVPFVVPPWLNATDPTAVATVDQRRAAYRLLPAPLQDVVA
jgi:hypothetical protein